MGPPGGGKGGGYKGDGYKGDGYKGDGYKGDGKGSRKGGKGGYGKDFDGRGRKGSDGDEGKPRMTLSSDAPDFTPAGYGGGYGGYDDGMAGYGGGWELPPMPLWREYADSEGVPYYYNAKTGLCQWERPPELDPPKPAPPPPAEPEAPPMPRAGKGEGGKDMRRPGGMKGDDDRRRDGGKGDGGGKGGGRGGDGPRRGRGGKDEAGKKEGDFGPPGCNLFVFHLPDDWTDDDLHEYFAPHGNIVSAKVMKELGTGRSRGFGFVSYEDRVSAATAIKKMQGYKILGKRLKVEFKKGEGESRDVGEEAPMDDAGAKKAYPDDERLIGYLRAISAKNVVQSLKESEAADADDSRDFLDDK